MSETGDYELVLTPPARRAITDRLPETVASAVIEFITTALVQQPRRVGKPLSGDLVGIWAARRGTYRVLYRVREQPGEVVVLRSSIAGMRTGRTSRPAICGGDAFHQPDTLSQRNRCEPGGGHWPVIRNIRSTSAWSG